MRLSHINSQELDKYYTSQSGTKGYTVTMNHKVTYGTPFCYDHSPMIVEDIDGV